jgi:hypothetical protein
MLSENTKKFNEYLAKSPELQLKINSLFTPFELINIAKQEGFELSQQEFKELAQQAYQQWLINLDSQTRLFFDQVHRTAELDKKLHQCHCGEDVITLAHQCGFEITLSDLKLAAQVAESISGFSFEKIFFQKLGLLSNK